MRLPWRLAAWAVACLVSLLFLYPYAWMLSGAFRSAEEMLARPLALWPDVPSLDAFRAIIEPGGVPLWRLALNSVGITAASAALSVTVTALGAYAVVRRPRALAFRLLRGGFLTVAMYPYMLLVMPVYFVMHQLGLLGSVAGIVLFLSLGPVQFFLFEQFFRTLPAEVLEAASLDGAGELTTLFRIVLPMAQPVVATVLAITVLLNWAQWFPVLVISSTPDTYTLPVALLNLNGELGTSFQAVMAMAVLATLPPAALFLVTQRRVMGGMAEGAVKG